MFIKPFRTKNNIQLKSTERKKLRSKIESAFKVSEDELNQLFPAKSPVNHLKIIAYNGEQLNVYTSDKRPLFFELSSDVPNAKTPILPTVYALWILPELVPMFTTHDAVFPRLGNGADLMLPGELNSSH